MIIIDETRPYEPLNMTTDDWLNIEPDAFDLHYVIFGTDTLVLSQSHLSMEALLKLREYRFSSYCGDPYIHIVYYKNKYYLVDGHHRFVYHLLYGYRFIEARIKIISQP